MTKYRIRLHSGRVLGPFEKKQLFELRAKGHILGDEEAQLFPAGNWDSIKTFDFYQELMDDDRTAIATQTAPKEETFVIDLAKLRAEQLEKEIESYAAASPPVPAEELTETKQLSTEEKKQALSEFDDNKDPESDGDTAVTISQNLKIDFEDPLEGTPEGVGEKTLINPIAQEEIEKIKRQKKAEDERKTAKEEARLKAEADEAEAEKFELVVAQEIAPVSANDATQVIKVNKAELLETAKEGEDDIQNELVIIQKNRAIDEAKEREENGDYEGEEESSSGSKKKLILLLAGIAAFYVIFFPDEKPKRPPFKHIEPKIVFPIPFDKADPLKSKVEYNHGLKTFTEGGYPNLVRAGLSFKNSYENDLDNVEALNFMVRVYAEQLKNSSEKLEDAQTLFSLIQSKRPTLVQDPNGTIGLNLFYMTIDKTNAAIDVVQKYLKLNPKNLTQDLFAVYIRSLLKKGKIDIAKQFYLALLKEPNKNRYTYAALIDYLVLNQENDKAFEYVNEALNKFPKLPDLHLRKAEMLIKDKKIEEAVPFLANAEKLGLDRNNLTRSKFYELKGLVFASRNKPKKAAKYLARSLKLNDTDDLRIKLAELETSGGRLSEVDKLISESKAVKYYLQARDFYDRKSYELAMSAAAKATDAFPGHIPSELFLAKTQLKLGLAQQGLQTLEELAKKYPGDKSVNLALIQAYIDTYKFNDAKNRIQIISTSDYRDSWEYASVNAQLFLNMGDTLQAMSWLKYSISKNPLNDFDTFTLAEILIRKANFNAARVLLNKCMELDPVNPDYRIAYARLIYETHDDRAAIGYLLSLLEDFGENPKVMSEIAIMYYRSGQVKAFQDYKEKLEKNHSQDKALYDFLIKAALLDERHSEIPGFVENYLQVEPGDLEKMMIAGRVLFENGKLVDAAKWFKRIQDKLPSFPMVRYYIAKIMYLSGDLKGALEENERDIKENGESDVSLVFKAQILQDQKEYIEAENTFKRAQKLNPRSYDAIVGLADLSTMRNNHDLALDLYKRATKLKSDEPLVHKKIGDVYRQLGQGALAIEAYKLYLDMSPESPHKKNLENYINLMK